MSEPPSTADTAAATTTKPWPEFFDINSLSLPVSLSDATARLNYNLAHFRVNYINISLIVFFLTLAPRPLSLLVVFAVTLAWYFLFFNSSRTSPLDILGFEVDDRFLIAALSLISIVALFVAHAWMNLFVSVLISGAIVLLHAVLRNPSFGDQNPYGGLLDAESGAYRLQRNRLVWPCGYGDSCKFIHDWGDQKSGWQIEKEWEEAEKGRKRHFGHEDFAAHEEDDHDSLPSGCSICRKPLVDPMVTNCKNYFCGHCALKRLGRPLLKPEGFCKREKEKKFQLPDWAC